MSRFISGSVWGLALAIVVAGSARPVWAASPGVGGAHSPHVLLVRGGGGGAMGGGSTGGRFARSSVVGGFHTQVTPMMTTPATATHTTMTPTPMTTMTPHFLFVPVLYGGFGYSYPYLGYGNGNSNSAAASNGDNGLPPANLPQAADPGAPKAVGANAAPQNAVEAATIADAHDANDWAGVEYLTQAEAAFREGRYRDALRLANHAVVEEPRDPKSHELMSLSLFALADYSGSSIEAHARIALGPIADWATLFGYYGDQERYTSQLRALEKYSSENPISADARFLRAYQYLMTGHIEPAKAQLALAVRLAPNDKLAADLLKRYGADAGWSQPAPASAMPTTPQVAAQVGLPHSDYRADLYAAKVYFKKVSDFIDHLRSNTSDASTFGAIALWYDSYARKIDQLPVVGVDPELVAYSQRTVNLMRQASSLIKNANNKKLVRLVSVEPQYVTDIWGVTYRDYAAENDAKRAIRREETSNAGTSVGQILQLIEADTASTRQRMSLKYNDRF